MYLLYYQVFKLIKKSLTIILLNYQLAIKTYLFYYIIKIFITIELLSNMLQLLFCKTFSVNYCFIRFFANY